MTQVFSQQANTPKNLWHNLGLLSRARVVKLVDAGDSKSPAARRAGSIPAPGTSGFLQIAWQLPPTTFQASYALIDPLVT